MNTPAAVRGASILPIIMMALACANGSPPAPPPAPDPGGSGGSPGRAGSSGTTPDPAGSAGTSGSSGAAGTGGTAGTAGTGGATAGTGGSRPLDAAAPADAPAPDASPGDLPPAAFTCRQLLAPGGRMSQWVYPDGNGKLAYRPLNEGGDHIMDFSHAGYMGGGVALPTAPVVQTIQPSGGDDTPAIQGALDAVATRPLVDGLRGAVLLAPGTFQIAGNITLNQSGVVLRGSGSGAGGTEIRMVGNPRRAFFMQGTGGRAQDAAASATITDDYVPAGSRTFTVDNPGAFQVGDPVLVGRPVTAAWITLLGMDLLVRNGMPQTWIRPGTVLRGERVVTAIEGNRLTVDIPYPDSFDARYVKPPGGSIVKYSFPGRITQVGIEHLRVVGAPRAEGVNFSFVQLSAVRDAWIKDVVAHDVTTGVSATDTAVRVTIEDTLVSHTPVEYFTAAAPSDYNIDGTQFFIHRSGSRGGNKIFYHSTASGVVGPSVLLGFYASGMRSHIQPHQRWATGLLVDGTHLDSGNIEYINRGTAGSGHGWTMGWGVVWNSIAPSIKVFQPEGTANWAIGNQGTPSGNGTFEAHGTPVAPASLYLAQLCQRLGPQALTNLGYPQP
jgi:hypothetical protein